MMPVLEGKLEAQSAVSFLACGRFLLIVGSKESNGVWNLWLAYEPCKSTVSDPNTKKHDAAARKGSCDRTDNDKTHGER